MTLSFNNYFFGRSALVVWVIVVPNLGLASRIGRLVMAAVFDVLAWRFKMRIYSLNDSNRGSE
jgi:hypothetical protein